MINKYIEKYIAFFLLLMFSVHSYAQRYETEKIIFSNDIVVTATAQFYKVQISDSIKLGTNAAITNWPEGVDTNRSYSFAPNSTQTTPNIYMQRVKLGTNGYITNWPVGVDTNVSYTFSQNTTQTMPNIYIQRVKLGTNNYITNWPEAPTNTTPTGPAGGDLFGSYPDPQIRSGVIINSDISDEASIGGHKVQAATDTSYGTVILGLDGATNAGYAIRATDPRLTNSRSPSGFASGDLQGSYPSPVLYTFSNLVAGVYGDGYSVPIVTIDQKGRIIAVSNVTILGAAPIGPANGDLTNSYPNPNIRDRAITTTKIETNTIIDNNVSDIAEISGEKITAGTLDRKGTVKLSTYYDALEGEVVQASDPRLTDSRYPMGDAGLYGGDLDGSYPDPVLKTLTSVNAGRYGDSGTYIPQIGVDSKGRITNIVNRSMSGVVPAGPAGGDLTGTYPNPALAAIPGLLAGTYATGGYYTATISVDSKGRITSITNTLILGAEPTGPASGDLTDNYPNPTIAAGVVNSNKIASQAISDVHVANTAAINGSKITYTFNRWEGEGHDPVLVHYQGVVSLAEDGEVNALYGVKANDGRLSNSRVPTGSAGGDLTGTYPSPTLPTNGMAIAGTYGNTNGYYTVVFSTDGKGRVTSAQTVQILGAAPTGEAGGDLTGNYPNPTLASSGVAAGAYGSSSNIPIFNVDSKGRITSITTSSNLVFAGVAGGDLSGNYPNPQIKDGAITNSDIAENASIDGSKVKVATTVWNGVDAYTHTYGVVYLAGDNEGGSGKAVQANDTRLTDDRVPKGSAGGDLAGTYPNPILTNSGVTAGNYGTGGYHTASFVVDSKGRITGASNVVILGNAPTGPAGGDLTGNYPNPQVGADKISDQHIKTNAAIQGSKVMLATVEDQGVVVLATSMDEDEGKVIQANDPRLTDSRPTTGSAGGDLAGSYPSPTLASVPGLVSGTYGTGGYHTATMTVDEKGRITSVQNTLILGAAPTGPAGGDLTGNFPNPAVGVGKIDSDKILDLTILNQDISTSANIAGTKIEQATTTRRGAVMLALGSDTSSNKVVQANDPRLYSARPPSGDAGGDLVGTYPNPTLTIMSGLTAGTYGSATSTPVITVDGKGRITAVENESGIGGQIASLQGQITAETNRSISQDAQLQSNITNWAQYSASRDVSGNSKNSTNWNNLQASNVYFSGSMYTYGNVTNTFYWETNTPSQGTVYYVAPSGSDANNGLAWTTAKATISNALTTAGNGNTILVSNGTYNITTQLSVNVTVVLKSVNGPEVTTIQGPASGNAVRCVAITANATVEGFTIAGGYRNFWVSDKSFIYGNYGAGAYVSAGNLRNCIVKDNWLEGWSSEEILGGGIYVSGSGSIYNCKVYNNTALNGSAGGGGIYIDVGGVVYNCDVYTNSTSGGKESGAVHMRSGGKIYNSLIRQNNQAGLKISNENIAYTNHVYNCTIVDNVTYGIMRRSPFSGGGTRIYNSIVYGNPSNDIFFAVDQFGIVPVTLYTLYDTASWGNQGAAPGAGCIDGNPSFVGSGSYRLSSSSVAINAGSSSYSTYSPCLDGYARIRGSGLDMGVYEYEQTYLPISVDISKWAEKVASQDVDLDGHSIVDGLNVTAQAVYAGSITSGTATATTATLQTVNAGNVTASTVKATSVTGVQSVVSANVYAGNVTASTVVASSITLGGVSQSAWPNGSFTNLTIGGSNFTATASIQPGSNISFRYNGTTVTVDGSAGGGAENPTNITTVAMTNVVDFPAGIKIGGTLINGVESWVDGIPTNQYAGVDNVTGALNSVDFPALDVLPYVSLTMGTNADMVMTPIVVSTTLTGFTYKVVSSAGVVSNTPYQVQWIATEPSSIGVNGQAFPAGNLGDTLVNNGNGWVKFPGVSGQMFLSNTTVTVSNSMSSGQIQSVIDALPRNIGGNTLTFQFDDTGSGQTTYTLTNALSFQKFYNGTLTIKAKTTVASSLHTNQTVFLNFSSKDIGGLSLSMNQLQLLEIRGLNILTKTDSTYIGCINISYDSSPMSIAYNYLHGTSTAAGILVNIGPNAINATTSLNYLSGGTAGLYSLYQGSIYSLGDDDIGTKPLYFYYAAGGIIKKNTDVGSGSYADNIIGSGGVVVNVAGKILP